MKDWRGTLIERGSIIVYPGRHSSSLWMTEGRVIDITSQKPSWSGSRSIPVLLVQPLRNRGGINGAPCRKVRLTSIDRVTVVSSPDVLDGANTLADTYARRIATETALSFTGEIGTIMEPRVREAFIEGRRSCIPTIKKFLDAGVTIEAGMSGLGYREP